MINEPDNQNNALEDIMGMTNELDVDGERALWLAVLQQAQHDATRIIPPRHWRTDRGQSSVTTPEQKDARAFLNDPKRYGPICELLGIDVEWFKSQIG